MIKPLQSLSQGAWGYVAVFFIGVATGALASAAAAKRQSKWLAKKVKKLQSAGQERVHWAAINKEMLGMAPRLWMEVLDRKHRYAGLLSSYWQRWQLSDSRDNFFDWLDTGKGSLIDLPWAPRRLLDEWQVIYLKREEQPWFQVHIEVDTGRFLWSADGTPVTLPAPPLLEGTSPASSSTARARRADELLRPLIERARHRDALLMAARTTVEDCLRRGEPATTDRAEAIARPLVAEGLLCRLRDPFFKDRLDVVPTADGGSDRLLIDLKEIPLKLLPGLTWQDFLCAIDHDQGQFMPEEERTRKDEEAKGIFVLDSFGPLYCGTKIRGMFHHSSFVRGHCIKVAGGLKIRDGWLEHLSPHSGHYQPSQEHVEDMISQWKQRGVDFSRVRVAPYVKAK